MRYVLAVILVILLAIIILLFGKITVRFSYGESGFVAKIKLLCFWYTYDSSKPKKKKNKSEKDENTDTDVGAEDEHGDVKEKRSIGQWIDKIKEYYRVFSDVKSVAGKVLRALRFKIEARDIVIKAVYGTGDAAKTGMAYGAAWAAVSQLYMLLSGYVKFEFPQLELTPLFDRKCFSLSADGIICFRAVHIIKAAIVGFIAYYRRTSAED